MRSTAIMGVMHVTTESNDNETTTTHRNNNNKNRVRTMTATTTKTASKQQRQQQQSHLVFSLDAIVHHCSTSEPVGLINVFHVRHACSCSGVARFKQTSITQLNF
jgi:hypothetical protein